LANPSEDKILLGKRKDSGLFGLPGGWLEKGEEWEQAACRELKEETGLVKEPSTFRHIHTLNCRVIDKGYHNISCIMYNEIETKDILMIKNAEPDKCAGWFWVTFKELRSHIDNLFHPLKDFLGKFPNLNNVSYLQDMIKLNNIDNLSI
jgi:ADP-ribose pyrophosphatase YjhB (NUDIX family)